MTITAHNREQNAPHMVAVYDGRAGLGHVLGRGRAGFEAFDVDNGSLGIFSSQREAAAAIMGAQ
jgi:hypothetical protein